MKMEKITTKHVKLRKKLGNNYYGDNGGADGCG